MKYFAGLDVSLDETAICIVDEDGIIITEGKAATEAEDLARWITATGLTIIASDSRPVRSRRGCMRGYGRRGCRQSASRPDE